MDAILFDWMGVLFKDPDVIGTVFPRILGQEMQRCGLSLEEMCARYYPYSEGKLSREAFWRGFDGNIDDLERNYLDSFQLNEGYEYVKSLRGRFKLGIVSNLPAEWGDYLIEKYDFDKSFNPIVVSGNVGVRKPEPEIYRIALRGLGVANKVYVVDDKTSNLRAAEEHLGWTGIWMRSQPANSDFVPRFQIDRLTDLKEILPA
ncbi:MAG: HAD-IA family hydrolase [bacterium]|nr:HAD-IA family hydrolase [bacterium]